MCMQSVVVCALSVVCVLLMSEGAVARVGHFTHYWAVHIEGGRPMADKVAAEHGFVNLDEIIPDHYHFRHNSVHKRSANPSPHHHTKLTNDGRVRWAQQQRILSRKKRDFIPLTMLLKSTSSPADVRLTSAGFTNSPSSTSSGGIRPDRDLIPPFFQADRRLRNIPFAAGASSYFPLNDQLWPKMWYLNRGSDLDMNVVAAWREGITGKGVVVTILDDGLEKDHPDLLVNYDPQASYDVNNHDEDPMPRYDMIDSNRHGTRCAGEVAATANNSLCAVGIAFGANVGGVRMLDGDVTDAVEARSLSLNPQHIDIYSASWGPDDDGKTVDGPGELATRAFIEGVTKGRSGKGSIFVWASGNGGNERDNCNCDGYTNSIWTLSISSATENGDVPWYSEMCSSTLATTYSSGSSTERQVITTDLHHTCTSSHTGTSASAPLAAGICALALEANKDLTWRDMQHIVVRTAKPANLQHSGWRTNGVGRNVSHSFGYGLMDAAAMVRLARSWKTVPVQHRCEVSSQHVNKPIPPKSLVVLQLKVEHCAGVNYLEHVQAKITLSAPRRGDLQINLTSPAGTMVTLLATRTRDVSRAGFVAWPFMSVHTWGESPYGIWQLNIHNEGKYMAELTKWNLIFYGTETPAQPDSDFVPGAKIDPLNSGGHLGIGEGEAGQHNFVQDEYVGSKWRDEQKVREEGRIEVRPGGPNPGTAEFASSGCLNYGPSQPLQCIECHQSLYLYEGQCVPGCPNKTFATSLFQFNKPQPKPMTLQSEENPVSSSLRRSSVKNIHDARNIMKPQPLKTCKPCHYTCTNCTGPLSYQCTSCPDDAKLINSSNASGFIETYCYPTKLLPALENAIWLKRFYVFFGIAAFVIVCAILYFVISTLLMNFDMCNKSRHQEKAQSNIGYDRLNPDEKTKIDIESEINRTIYDSDSDSSV